MSPSYLDLVWSAKPPTSPAAMAAISAMQGPSSSLPGFATPLPASAPPASTHSSAAAGSDASPAIPSPPRALPSSAAHRVFPPGFPFHLFHRPTLTLSPLAESHTLHRTSPAQLSSSSPALPPLSPLPVRPLLTLYPSLDLLAIAFPLSVALRPYCPLLPHPRPFRPHPSCPQPLHRGACPHCLPFQLSSCPAPLTASSHSPLVPAALVPHPHFAPPLPLTTTLFPPSFPSLGRAAPMFPSPSEPMFLLSLPSSRFATIFMLPHSLGTNFSHSHYLVSAVFFVCLPSIPHPPPLGLSLSTSCPDLLREHSGDPRRPHHLSQ
ncbi:unnamed protein product [Closterium sp. Naga37s-1]|nr:unnamed protein product [Closterium sp. Naga37s-1]